MPEKLYLKTKVTFNSAGLYYIEGTPSAAGRDQAITARVKAFKPHNSTIMDKSLGTNLHFWRFCAHARREYNFTCLTSLPIPPYNVEN